MKYKEESLIYSEFSRWNTHYRTKGYIQNILDGTHSLRKIYRLKFFTHLHSRDRSFKHTGRFQWRITYLFERRAVPSNDLFRGEQHHAKLKKRDGFLVSLLQAYFCLIQVCMSAAVYIFYVCKNRHNECKFVITRNRQFCTVFLY